MGARIDDGRRAQYVMHRQAGTSRQQSARLAGVSNAWAVGFDRDLDDDEVERLLSLHPTGNGTIGDPIPYDQLSPLASALLGDFEQWRVKVMGRHSRPWAIEAAQTVADLFDSADREFCVINCAPGLGKDLAVDTPILTTRGWRTMGTIRVGERVFDERGEPCRVVAKSEVFTDHECYTVSTDDGASVVAGKDHEWLIRLEGYGQYHDGPKADYAGKTGPRPERMDGKKVRTTEFLARKRNKRPQLEVADPIQLRARALLIDPYVLGVWLGDGNSSGGGITSHPDDQKFVRGEIEAAGFTTTDHVQPNHFGVLRLQGKLRRIGVLNDKHIPAVYLHASAEQRLALLQGLIDTDGHVNPKGGIEFCSTNFELAAGVQFLVRSLGAKAGIAESRAMLYGKDCGPRWRVTFMLEGAARLPRKAVRTRNGVRTPHRYLTATPTMSVPTQCIQVDSPSKLYLAGAGLMVTHNSSLFSNDICAWLTCRSRTIRGVIGSIKAPLSARYTRRLRLEFERESPLRAGMEAREQRGAVDAVTTMGALYGRFKPLKPVVWRADGFIVDTVDEGERTEKEYTWLAASMEEDFIGDRVNYQSWDDAATKASSRSAEIRARHFDQWGVIEDRLEPNGLLLLVGQRLTLTDLYRHNLDKRVTREIEGEDGDELEDRPKYHHIVYKAHYDEKCEQQHARDAPAWPEGCLLDPSGLPWRDLVAKQATKGEYLLVYQQDDSADPEATFRHVWIHGGREEQSGIIYPGCWDGDRDPGELPIGLSDDTLSYCSVDPSASGYWVVLWVVYDRKTQQRHVIDMSRQKMGANDLLDMMPGSSEYRGIMEDWQARSVSLGRRIRYWIIEHNSQQKWLSQYEWARQWYTSRGVKVISHQTYAYSKLDDKLGPEGSLPRLFEGGTIRLPGSPKGRLQMRPFVDELLHWGAHPTNDTVMAAWMGEYALPTMLKQPDEDDWVAPVMWRPSWMRREGEMRRSQLAMLKLTGQMGYDDDDRESDIGLV